jgi:4-amino-4-deoxy-L-arabinose transferase-like glycosyltransferase
LDVEERAFWRVVLSLAWSLSVALVLAALERYRFERLLIVDAALSLFLALIVIAGRTRWREIRPAPVRWSVILPLCLIVLGAWRFFPPSEYIIGGKDPGVYVNAGIQIAQRGAIIVRDPVVAMVPPFARDLFFPPDRNTDYYLSVRFMGFFIRDPDTGAVVSQFQHVFPASVAVGYGIDGLTGARRAVSFWAVLGLLSVYFAGARLFGRPAAAAAAFLLALNVIEVWFGRYPNIEMTLQALLFAALLANARAHVEDDPFFAPIAGALLVLLLFARFDAGIAVGATVIALSLEFAAGQGRLRLTFWIPLVAGGLLCGWYLIGPMRAYSALPLYFIRNLPRWMHLALLLGAAAGAALLFLVRRSPRLSERTRDLLPIVLAVGVTALAVYALFLRRPGRYLAPFDAYALRIFADYYFTLPALIAALIGYVLFARRLFWRDPAFFLTLTAFSLLFFYKTRIVPEHFWAARRYVPVILPGLLLLVAAAALTGARGRSLVTRAIRGPIGIVFLALLAAQYARVAKPIADHVEYEGVIPRVEKLAGRIQDDDLLVVESRDSGSDAHVFALPLAYTYARNVLVLSTAVPDKPTFGAFLDRMHARYRRVLFLGGGGTDLLSSRWSVEPIDSERFQIPEYDSPRNAFPKFVKRKEFDYSVYAFGPPPAQPPDSALDIGINDDLNVIRFYAKEQSEGHTIRWTQKQSIVIINHIGAGDRTLALWMNDGGRPPAAPPADVSILVDGRVLGVVHVTGGFKEYDVAIPPDVAAAAAAAGEPVRVMLRSSTWNPQSVLGTADDRDLGVMVDRVAVR